MSKLKDKRKKRIDELADRIILVLEVWGFGKSFVPRWLVSRLGESIGDIRAALHLLNLRGIIRQMNRGNWAHGGLHRGAQRPWFISKNSGLQER